MTVRLLSSPALLFLSSVSLIGGCACGPISHAADGSIGTDAPITTDAMETTPDAGWDAPDAGPPRFPPLPECPLQPGQAYLPGAGSAEGTVATLPAPVHSSAFGGDVAAFLHPEPWRVSEARAERTPLLHDAFEPTLTEPFRSDIALSVAGDGTIWLTRADWRNLDEHGRSLELIGRQIISIYCGVRTVELHMGESELGPGARVEGGVPIPTPDGATLIDIPGRGVLRSFVGESEPFLGAGESMGPVLPLGGRLLFQVVRAAGAPYLAEYDGAPVSAADALLDDVVAYGGRVGDPPMFCGRLGADSELLAPSPTGLDERVSVDGPCFTYGWVEGGARWLLRRPPAADPGYYRWDLGAAPQLRVPLPETLPDGSLVPFSDGGFIVYYASDTVPRYRIRYADVTRTTELGAIELPPSASGIVAGTDHAHFVTGNTLVWLTETERFEQTIDGLALMNAGSAPDGAAWLTARMRFDGASPNRSRLLRVRPTEAPQILLDEIESASFGWLDGVGFGEVFAFDERVDALGFYFVDGASDLRRIGQTGTMVSELRALDGHLWLLSDSTLGRVVDGSLRPELTEVRDIAAAVRDEAGRVWFTSRRPTPDGYWTTRIARVSETSIEVIEEETGSGLSLLDGGSERDFARAPWGFVTRGSDPRACPFASPRECVALPEADFAAVITASGRLFAWRAASETTLVTRSAR